MTSKSPWLWHNMSLEEIFLTVDGTPDGLTTTEVQARLSRYGLNRLPQQRPPTPWQILLQQFRSPLIYILGLAAFVSVAIGDIKDAAFIGAVLAINAMIGGYQEWRAVKNTLTLQQLLKIRAAVMRDREVEELDAEQLVQGDVVWLESGNLVPADIRLMKTYNLEIDESLLTGESLPVLKSAEWIGVSETPLGDRRNMIYAGSTVVRGRGRGVVIATGTATEVGQLATEMLKAEAGKPPLVERMEKFSQKIALIVLIVAFTIALIGIFVQGYSVTEMFLFGIALAVSAIPEGLPVALTITLAIATTRMARRGVIVRRLPAVEGLGSCTLIASDKTGTLTCNELTVQVIELANGDRFQVTGEGFVPEGKVLHQGKEIVPERYPLLNALARAAVLCNEADLHHSNHDWLWRGDPTDAALLVMAHKLGWNREVTLNHFPQLNEIPFEPEHQFAATYHQMEDGIQVFVKGAPERVLAMCDELLDANTAVRFTEIVHHLTEQGYRVLALAEGSISEPLPPEQVPPQPIHLKLLGFVGMIDPLRPGVREAIATCHSAGIQVWMVTGDHPQTALAIARNLGLADKSTEVMTSTELSEQLLHHRQDIIKTIRVFARVTPDQKLQLVNAARQSGHFVAVTGDGVNDAPALRTANIGVAMGKSGTDVAREASELVISDDHFATIVVGIEEGRVAYNNIRKVIYLLISTGAAEVVLVGLAITAGLPLPLLPVQLLWLNLVTNGIQDVALASEKYNGSLLGTLR
jgi:magnesium-transporting ATPase (P-type)